MICRLCEVRQQTTTNDTVYCRVRLVAGTFVICDCVYRTLLRLHFVFEVSLVRGRTFTHAVGTQLTGHSGWVPSASPVRALPSEPEHSAEKRRTCSVALPASRVRNL